VWVSDIHDGFARIVRVEAWDKGVESTRLERWYIPLVCKDDDEEQELMAKVTEDQMVATFQTWEDQDWLSLVAGMGHKQLECVNDRLLAYDPQKFKSVLSKAEETGRMHGAGQHPSYYDATYLRVFVKDWLKDIDKSEVGLAQEMFGGDGKREIELVHPGHGLVKETSSKALALEKETSEGSRKWSVNFQFQNRIGISNIIIPGLLQVQPYTQLCLDWDVTPLISWLLRFGKPRYKISPEEAQAAQALETQRQSSCRSCVAKGLAFCDRKAAAERSNFPGSWDETMDRCVPRTRESQVLCEDFELFHTEEDGKMSAVNHSMAAFRGKRDDKGVLVLPWFIDTTERCDDIRIVPHAIEDVVLQAKRRRFLNDMGLHAGGVDGANQCVEDESGSENVALAYQKVQEEKKLKNMGCGGGFQCCSFVNQTVNSEVLRCVRTNDIKQKFAVTKMQVTRSCASYRPADTVGVKWRNSQLSDCREAHHDVVKRRSTRAANRNKMYGKSLAVFDGHWEKSKSQWVRTEEPILTENISLAIFSVGDHVEASEEAQSSGEIYFLGRPGVVVKTELCDKDEIDPDVDMEVGLSCEKSDHCVHFEHAERPVCVPEFHLDRIAVRSTSTAATAALVAAHGTGGCASGYMCCAENQLKVARCVKEGDLPKHKSFWRKVTRCEDFRPPGTTSRRIWKSSTTCANPEEKNFILDGHWYKPKNTWELVPVK